ncbi:thiopeptide maturation pyridine synthase [Streptomyces sp. NPDC053079]|uniref:thiopeptide maturation pyridine synthase n=1 Tax=Streptomyces sp. NPDC053079 TaxID=3365697 RepID=UPI0037D067AC
MTWRSVQVRYYERNKDDLILDAVRPLFAELGDGVRSPYFQRHWRQGPHVRLNFRTADPDWEQSVLPTARRVLTGYLQDRPSTAVPDVVAELRRHATMARQEEERGPLSPWFPDNSVQAEPFDDRAHIFSDGRLVDLLGTAYAESSALAFAMLEDIRTGAADRLGLALDLMFCLAHTSLPPISRGYMSFRSHSEGFLVLCADAESVRAAFDATYRRQKDRLAERMHAVEAGRVPYVREWAAHTLRLKAAAEPLLAGGSALDRRASAGDARTPSRSELLDLLSRNEDYRQQVLSTTWFQSHRLAVNELYSHLGRLGIVPSQRFLLAHLVANTVEDAYGVSALGRARQFTAAHPGGAR